MKKLSTNGIFALLLGIFSFLALPITGNAQMIERGRVIERLHPEAYCGNGVVETDESCDHGKDNGTADSLCTQDCEWNVPEDKRDCVEEKVNQCLADYREKLRAGLVELREDLNIGLAEDGSPRVLEESDPKEQVPNAPAAEPSEDPVEKCLRQALEACEAPVEIPVATPVPTVAPEDKQQNNNPTSMLEGSGCSLGAASATSNGFGLLLSLGIFFSAWRRRS